MMQQIINDLHDALSSEIEIWMDKEVYLDRERLQGGDFYNEALATAICESLCMILVFTPKYFSREHTYCAREYKAMEELESRRLKSWGKLWSLDTKKNKQHELIIPHGLIIPIVVRGEDHLPHEIKKRRQYYNFEDFLLGAESINSRSDFARQIRNIAKYIADMYRTLETLSEDPCQGCESFVLPTEDEINLWIDEVQGPRPPFPMP